MKRTAALATAGMIGLAAGSAHATWSVLIVNTRTGEIGVASCTCLTNLDLRELTPMLVTNLGGLTAQSAGDSRGVNRTFVRDRMIEGVAPEEILDLLADFDPGHQSRQYGMVDAQGRAATFSGSGDGQWAGGVTGQVGDFVYAVQGNVLTGAPVVAMAEAAIITTPGDLPERLMAAMEAAASMGGDGRCSCAPSAPESCGSPPPEFEKSAHVGYMLDARIGDFSPVYGIYDVGGMPGPAAVFDFDADGKPDIISSTATGSTLTVLRNITPADSSMTVMAEASQFISGWSDVGAILPGQWAADSFVDVALGSSSADGIRVLMGDGTGAFVEERTVAIPAHIDGLVQAMGGVAALSSGSAELRVLDPASDWATSATLTLTGSPRSMVADPADPMAVFVSDSDSGDIWRIVRNSGTLEIDRTIHVGTDVVSVAAGDVNADGRTDLLAVGESAKQGDLLLDNGTGAYDRQSFDAHRLGRSALLADFDGDGDIDPAIFTFGRANLQIIRNDANAAYVLQPEKAITRGPAYGLTHDMNGDGLADIVAGASTSSAVIIADNVHGRFADLLGTAPGDFYMQLNVPNARDSDPDPVVQLRQQFDEWRMGLLGLADAVHSSTQIDAIGAPVGSDRPVHLNITLRDWQQQPVTGPVNLRVEPTEESDGVSTVDSIENLGGGRYRVTLFAGESAGQDTLNVIADAGDRTVILTPRPVFRVVEAADDFDGDGTISFFDVQAFLNAFAAGDLAADLNGDGNIDFADVQLFLSIFSG